jgi:pimeloyl-ACP methyl ester carboxylesterase
MAARSMRSKRMSSTYGRRRSAVGSLGLVALLLAACAPSPEARTDELAQFTEQRLAWEGCDDYAVTSLDEQYFPLAPTAECARLSVPANYAAPGDGATASVAVVRIPASGESQGALFFNPGGPGGPGLLGTMGAWAGMADTEIVERFDLVGFDPRGVGATTPAIDCYDPTGTTAGDKVFARLGTVAPQLDAGDTRALVDRCAEGSGGRSALGQVGTRTAASDMDVLRAVLGEEKLTFLGQSYGTRLGTVYAEQFPEHVRAMVLDGAFDPNLGKSDRLLASYGGFQVAFEAMAASCAAGPDCPLGTDASAWTTRFQAIMQPLVHDPVPAGDELVGFDAALGGVMAGLYTPEAWPTIISGLREVEAGRGDQLLQLSNAIAGVTDDGVSTNQSEALLAINCVDEAVLDAAEIATMRSSTYAQAPFMNPGTSAGEATRDQCADWPVTDQLGTPYAQDLPELPRLLVVSITGDATTPHAGGIALAKALDGTLLTIEGDGHTVVSQNLSDCVTKIAADYLIRLTTPTQDATCTLREPTPTG